MGGGGGQTTTNFRLDDIIVGAPTYVNYTKEKGAIKANYETGKVYVFYQGDDVRLLTL